MSWCNRNHCTCFIDNWFGTWIGEACIKHDIAYENQSKSKEVADAELFKDIIRLVPWYKGNYLLATIMWLGVRTGGYVVAWNRIKENR